MLLQAHANAVVYRWANNEGQTHFSQTPPEQCEVEVINTAPSPFVDVEKSQKEIDDLIKQQTENNQTKQQQEQ